MMEIKTATLKRLFSSEIRNLNKVLVTKKKNLKELLQQEKPSATNREGEKHLFRKEELKKITQKLPSYRQSDLKLPISFYRDTKMKDFYVKGKIEAEIVREIINYKVRAVQGKLFISKPLVYKILRNFPTTTQLVWLF